jgi:hypothetical protein
MDKLVQELKKKGKYDEWVSLGSYYGQTGSIFTTKGYKYYDMDGDIINVSCISNVYRDVTPIVNTPVFKQYYVKDETHVRQAKYKIVSNSEELSTSGLATCCGLTILLGNKKFLAHLDTSMKNKIPPHVNESYYDTLDIILTRYDREMVKILQDEIHNEIKNEIKATIYAGNLYSDLSVKKAKKICNMVGIADITIVKVDMFDRVTI